MNMDSPVQPGPIFRIGSLLQSGPPATTDVFSVRTKSPAPQPEKLRTSQKLADPMPLADDSDSDSEMPEIGNVLRDDEEKRAKADQQRKLMEVKQRTLAMQTAKPTFDDDEDDDLEIASERVYANDRAQILVKAEEQQRKAGKKLMSNTRKDHLRVSGVGLSKPKAARKPSDANGLPFLLSGASRSPEKSRKGTHKLLSQAELNQLLARKVQEGNQELTTRKEAEWVRRGGKIVNSAPGGQTLGVAGSTSEALKAYAEKAMKAAVEKGAGVQADDEDDSDEDWAEMRGSASPSPQPEDLSGQNDGGDNEDDADITMVDEADENLVSERDPEDQENHQIRAPRRSRAIVDSESEGENDENAIPMPSTMLPPHMQHRGSLSSLEGCTEDEYDKENNTSLIFDRSEDKENKAVVRHTVPPGRPLFGTRKSSLFDLEDGVSRGLSMSPGLENRSADADDEDEANDENVNVTVNKRKPMKLMDEDVFASKPGSTFGSPSFAARLQQASPVRTLSRSGGLPALAPSPTLAPFLGGGKGKGKASGFSQFSDDDGGGFGAMPLQASFSDLFESGTEKQGSVPLGESFSDKVRDRSK